MRQMDHKMMECRVGGEGGCTCSSLVIFSSSGKRMGAMCGRCWSVNSAQNSGGGDHRASVHTRTHAHTHTHLLGLALSH